MLECAVRDVVAPVAVMARGTRGSLSPFFLFFFKKKDDTHLVISCGNVLIATVFCILDTPKIWILNAHNLSFPSNAELACPMQRLKSSTSSFIFLDKKMMYFSVQAIQIRTHGIKREKIIKIYRAQPGMSAKHRR